MELHKSTCQNTCKIIKKKITPSLFSNLVIMQQRSPAALISHKFLTNFTVFSSLLESQNIKEYSTLSDF